MKVDPDEKKTSSDLVNSRKVDIEIMTKQIWNSVLNINRKLNRNVCSILLYLGFLNVIHQPHEVFAWSGS